VRHVPLRPRPPRRPCRSFYHIHRTGRCMLLASRPLPLPRHLTFTMVRLFARLPKSRPRRHPLGRADQLINWLTVEMRLEKGVLSKFMPRLPYPPPRRPRQMKMSLTSGAGIPLTCMCYSGGHSWSSLQEAFPKTMSLSFARRTCQARERARVLK